MEINTVQSILTQHKAKDIVVLDVNAHTPLIDYIVICTASSNRHAKSLAEHLIKSAKQAKSPLIKAEGLNAEGWILVNVGDIVAHIMLADKREFYQIEDIWDSSETSNLSIEGPL